MSMHWWQSNRVEALQQLMTAYFRQQPLASPFTSEVILIPSMAMRRWLSLRLADDLGIRCQQDFSLPSSWLWAQVLQNTPHDLDDTLFSREAMSWRCFSALPAHLENPAFASVQRYLQDDPEGLRRWQLAERLGDAFDRYHYYRPEWIQQWCRADYDADDWQAILWRAITDDADMHPLARLEQWLAALPDNSKQLPERISIFCIPAMPPVLWRALTALSSYCTIHLWQCVPTAHYWADLSSARQQAQQRLQHWQQQDANSLADEPDHELLAAWGRQGQQMQDILLDTLPAGTQQDECWQEDWPATLLGELQRSLFTLTPALPTDQAADDSLQLHICHSPMREVQVLHDNLLRMLNEDPQLHAEDILVMIPDLMRYAPYIEAVFSHQQPPLIPWNCSDLNLQGSEPLLNTVLQLLQLPEARLSRSEVLSLLKVPQLAARFSLHDIVFSELEYWLDKLGVRWGLDAEHRHSLGLPAWSEQTWQAGEDRWLSGFTLGNEMNWNGIAPVSIDRENAEMLAALSNFLDTLRYWRQQLSKARCMADWQHSLLSMLQDFFIDDENDQYLPIVRQALADMNQLADSSVFSLPLLRQLLKRQLQGSEMRHRYLSGGVNICGMRPMRAVPFRVIALLGMQDDVFPHRERATEIDRMSRQRQVGDPHKGDEDRYLMLETLLSARHCLYISYCGRNIRDNSALQPSLPISELLDFINQHGDLASQITRIHPMQPFSAANFRSPYQSFDQHWCDIASCLQQPTSEITPQHWSSNALSAPQPAISQLSWRDLGRFVQHPIRYFFQQRLEIFLSDDAQDDNDEENFALDGLQAWLLRQHCLQQSLQQTSPDVLRLRADGHLAIAEAGRQWLEEAQQSLNDMKATLDDYTPITPSMRYVRIECDELTISGQIASYYPERGLLMAKASKLSGKHLMPLWLQHLALCAGEQLKQGECSLLLCKDQQWQIPLLPAEQAMQYLRDIIQDWRDGLCHPLAIFPQTSWAWMQEKDLDKQNTKARNEWLSGYQKTGELDSDAYLQLAMRGTQGEPWQWSVFQQYAQRWYAPIMEASQ